jgi:pimeloyl-ACP methyl ester carboxylesterase
VSDVIDVDDTATATDLHVGRQRLRVMVDQPGTGRPLLLINGIGATGDLFRPFAEHLTDLLPADDAPPRRPRRRAR